MVSRSTILIAFMMLLNSANALATQARIETTVDRTEVTLGEPIILTITVHDAGNAQPSMPSISGFEARSLGQSNQMKNVNGVRSSSISYRFELTAKSAGTLTIGPASMIHGGKSQRSQAIKITVLERPKTQPGNQHALAGELFLTAEIDKTNPYVQEQITYTMRFYRRVRVSQANASLPDFTGFLAQDLGNQRDYRTVLNGHEYQVTEISKALFAQRAGAITIEAPKLDVQTVYRSASDPFDGFFGGQSTKREQLRGDEISLHVKALPTAPAEFSGLVGQFTLSASLSRTALAVGDSTTLTLRIEGTGNAHQIIEPNLKTSGHFKVYDDKPQEDLGHHANTFRGSKTFHKSLVPTQAGTVAIGPLALIYFDTAKGQYETVESDSFRLNVAAGSQPEELQLTELAAAAQRAPVVVQAEDLMPIYGKAGALGRPWRPSMALFWMLFWAPPLLFGCSYLFKRRQTYSPAGLAQKRRRHALKIFHHEVSSLNGQSDAAALAAAVRRYLGNKFGIEANALTTADATARLLAARVQPDVVHAVEALLADLDRAQYGGLGALSANVSASAESMVKNLERHL